MKQHQAAKPTTKVAASKAIASPTTIKRLRYTTLAAYAGLLLLMPLWLLWLHPSSTSYLSLIVFWLPLLLPLKGLLQGKPYTYAWANFVVLLNFSHSCCCLWLFPAERQLALLELIFSTLMLICGSYYARQQGRKLGQKLPKLSQLP